MTGSEFKRIREELKLGVSSMARALGLQRQSIHEFESGRRVIRPAVEKSVQWLAELKRIDPTNRYLPIEVIDESEA